MLRIEIEEIRWREERKGWSKEFIILLLILVLFRGVIRVHLVRIEEKQEMKTKSLNAKAAMKTSSMLH